MENKFYKIRKDLDDLGYHFTLIPESIPLVERLIGDLKTTTESLEKYMNIAKLAIEERDNLEFGAEPYRCDNAKLVKECNELHSKLLKAKDQYDTTQKEFKYKVTTLQREKQEALTEVHCLRKQVADLEFQLNNSNLQKRKSSVLGDKSKLKSSSAPLLKGSQVKKATTFELNSAMALADQKIASLGREVKKLKDQHLELIETNEMYKNQLFGRDREIERLKNLLDGGRPLTALNKECCYKDVDGKLHKMQDQINTLMKEKCVLEDRLKESLAKQHEAMKRALHLAERNKHLEKELKDIDQIALQVESECNVTVKSNLEKFNRLQDRMHDTVLQIQSLEKDNSKLKQEKLALRAELEAVQMEKKHLQSIVETALDDKKKLTDRFNQFAIIEHDLNMEIDRLVQLSADQKRKIAELECNLYTEKPSGTDVTISQKQVADRGAQYVPEEPRNVRRKQLISKSPNATKKRSKQTKKAKSPVASPTRSPNRVPFNTPKESMSSYYAGQQNRGDGDRDAEQSSIICCKGCCSTGGCVQHFRDLLTKEIEYRQTQSAHCIDSLKKEKEFYMDEYRKLVNDMKDIQKTPDSAVDLISKLNEKEQTILTLQHENKILSEEKYNLMTRLESARERPTSDMEGGCMKNYCRRMEREREILRADIERLEEERDCLRHRIKTMADTHASEHQRLQQSVQESEEQIRKLELERRELMQTQGSRRANISCLEEQVDTLKEQVKNTEHELTLQRTLYSQLKNLHEQTDKALSDCQGQLIQVESELAHAQEKIKTLERDKDMVDRDESGLKKDCNVLKSQLTQMDKEKDELLNALDEKAERIAQLQKDLMSRDNRISSLEATIGDLQGKINSLMDETGSRDVQLKTSNAEMNALKRELELLKSTKDNMAQENRRIRDDLSSAACDCKEARHELDLAKRQIEDLKRQLQQYVAEVKRTEDILSQKEIERNELLDQFRNLSHEANQLENNNHSLENEASQTKVQLSVALDHASELDKKLDNQESLIRSYEKQISEMTAQIASLEFKLSHGSSQHGIMEAELQNMKCLCMRLDKEKDDLKHEMLNRNDQTIQVERSMERLKCETETLKNNLLKDRNTIESLEKLLNEARQESVEHKLLNQELQSEISRLKGRLGENQDKLTNPVPGRGAYPNYDELCSCENELQTNININVDTQPAVLRDRVEKSFKVTNDKYLTGLKSNRRPDKFACDPTTCQYLGNTNENNQSPNRMDQYPCDPSNCQYLNNANQNVQPPKRSDKFACDPTTCQYLGNTNENNQSPNRMDQYPCNPSNCQYLNNPNENRQPAMRSRPQTPGRDVYESNTKSPSRFNPYSNDANPCPCPSNDNRSDAAPWKGNWGPTSLRNGSKDEHAGRFLPDEATIRGRPRREVSPTASPLLNRYDNYNSSTSPVRGSPPPNAKKNRCSVGDVPRLPDSAYRTDTAPNTKSDGSYNRRLYQSNPGNGSNGMAKPRTDGVNENRFCSSFCVDGPRVQSYAANYTVVHSPDVSGTK